MLANKEEWQEGKMDCVEWCKIKQEECLDNGDVAGALAYNELAKLWMRRRDERGKV